MSSDQGCAGIRRRRSLMSTLHYDRRTFLIIAGSVLAGGSAGGETVSPQSAIIDDLSREGKRQRRAGPRTTRG
jgi:hypothetical protein